MDMTVINQVTKIVCQLEKLGIHAVEGEPTEFRAFEGLWGSVANYAKVCIGAIRTVRDPLDNEHLGVHVHYEARRESGEDLCDYFKQESRYVKLEELINWLAERGIK